MIDIPLVDADIEDAAGPIQHRRWVSEYSDSDCETIRPSPSTQPRTETPAERETFIAAVLLNNCFMLLPPASQLIIVKALAPGARSGGSARVDHEHRGGIRRFLKNYHALTPEQQGLSLRTIAKVSRGKFGRPAGRSLKLAKGDELKQKLVNLHKRVEKVVASRKKDPVMNAVVKDLTKAMDDTSCT